MKDSVRNSPLWIVTTVLVVTIFATASCTQSSRTIGRPPESMGGPSPAQTNLQGGQDAGGGNVAKSEVKDVQEAARDLRSLLEDSFHRVEFYSEDAARIDAPLSERQGDPLADFFDLAPAGSLTARKIKEVHGLIDDGKIQNMIGRIEIRLVSGNCQDPASHEPTDGSMDAQGNMCISLKRLTRFPKEDLRMQLLALAAHELSHLHGYDEGQAKLVQQAWLDMKKITVEDEWGPYEDAFSFNVTASLLRHAQFDLQGSTPRQACGFMNQAQETWPGLGTTDQTELPPSIFFDLYSRTGPGGRTQFLKAQKLACESEFLSSEIKAEINRDLQRLIPLIQSVEDRIIHYYGVGPCLWKVTPECPHPRGRTYLTDEQFNQKYPDALSH